MQLSMSVGVCVSMKLEWLTSAVLRKHCLEFWWEICVLIASAYTLDSYGCVEWVAGTKGREGCLTTRTGSHITSV